MKSAYFNYTVVTDNLRLRLVERKGVADILAKRIIPGCIELGPWGNALNELAIVASEILKEDDDEFVI